MGAAYNRRLPAALIAMAPIAAASLWLVDLGVTAGFWSGADPSNLVFFGFVIAFALLLGGVQWFMLRRLLPRAELWFAATGAGILLTGLAAGIGLQLITLRELDPIRTLAVWLVALGLAIGLGQWLYLRRHVLNAFWIVPIEILAAGSLLLSGRSFTNLIELVVVLFLPGVIRGSGCGFYCARSNPSCRSR